MMQPMGRDRCKKIYKIDWSKHVIDVTPAYTLLKWKRSKILWTNTFAFKNVLNWEYDE